MANYQVNANRGNRRNNERQYTLSDSTFVNPYHFIPLEDGCERKCYTKLREEKGLLTGWIECKIETLTPIFIPNTNNEDFYKLKDGKGDKVNSYDFFSYQDNKEDTRETKSPIIPGSSLRGTIRSAFEAITNSCLSTTDDDFVLYKRSSTAALLGIVKKQGEDWIIQPCERYAVSTKDNRQDRNNHESITRTLNEGQKVYFTEGIKYQRKTRHGSITIFKCIDQLSTTKREDKDWLEGYYHHGEPFGRRKHHETIFFEKNSKPINIEKKHVESLLESYKLYQDDTVNLHYKKGEHSGYEKAFPKAKYRQVDELNGALIYYAEYNGNYYLSPAAIGREVFNNRLKDLLDIYPKGSYSPCLKKEELCPACTLFGFVSDEDQIASRVRFSDAKSKDFNFLEPVVIPELSGPKISATEMYFVAPDGADLWNADYTVPNDKNYQAKIQGRKFYWHHDPDSILKQDVKTPSIRNVKIRPLGKNSKFSFKIHFNSISEEELTKLLWTLTLGDNNGLAHKIGMAKPLGLGSIRIDVSSVKLRKLSLDSSDFYSVIDYTTDYYKYRDQINPNTLKALELLFNFKNQQQNIRYPYALGRNGYELSENYHWFVGNKQIDDRARGIKPIIEQALMPLSINQDPSLQIVINNRNDGDIKTDQRDLPTKKEQVIENVIIKDGNITEIEKLISIKDNEEFFIEFKKKSDEFDFEQYKAEFDKILDNRIIKIRDIVDRSNDNVIIDTLELLIRHKDCILNSSADINMVAGAVRRRNDFTPKNPYSPEAKYKKTYEKFKKEFNLN